MFTLYVVLSIFLFCTNVILFSLSVSSFYHFVIEFKFLVGGNGEQNLKISYRIVNFVIVVNANWNVGYKLHHEGILLKFEVAR